MEATGRGGEDTGNFPPFFPAGNASRIRRLRVNPSPPPPLNQTNRFLRSVYARGATRFFRNVDSHVSLPSEQSKVRKRNQRCDSLAGCRKCRNAVDTFSCVGALLLLALGSSVMIIIQCRPMRCTSVCRQFAWDLHKITRETAAAVVPVPRNASL